MKYSNTHMAASARCSEEIAMINRPVLAALCLVFHTASASALEANVSQETALAPAQAWQAIGDFCGIAKWHPEVASCEPSEVMGAKLRRIKFKDGGTMREQLVEQNAETMEQKSLMLDGTLTVRNYQATLKVVPTATGAAYTWSGVFETTGASEDEAVQSLTRFYTAGIGGLVQQGKK